MTSDEFVLRLLSLMPSAEKLADRGIDYVEKYQRLFICAERNVERIYDNPALDLIHRYDCSNIVIGMVRFLSQLIEGELQFQIAKDEADPLLLDKRTGEIYVVDHADHEYVIHRCAKDGPSFLEALAGILVAVEMLADIGFPEDIALRRTLCEPSVEAAGGSEYEAFYRYLLICA